MLTYLGKNDFATTGTISLDSTKRLHSFSLAFGGSTDFSVYLHKIHIYIFAYYESSVLNYVYLFKNSIQWEQERQQQGSNPWCVVVNFSRESFYYFVVGTFTKI